MRPTFAFLVLAVAGLVALAVFSVEPRPGASAGPGTVVEWRVDGKPAVAYQKVKPEQEVDLIVDVPTGAAQHVYVAAWHPHMGLTALWPSPWLSTDAPQVAAPGTTTLPGMREETRLRWPVPAWHGVVDWLVVTSPKPIPELEQLFAASRQASNTTFPTQTKILMTGPKNAPDVEQAQGLTSLLTEAARTAPVAPRHPVKSWTKDPDVGISTWKLVVDALPAADGSHVADELAKIQKMVDEGLRKQRVAGEIEKGPPINPPASAAPPRGDG